MAKINRLKVVLVEKEKSDKWLADQLGKSTCTVSKWCSNTTLPDQQTLDRIAQLLKVDTRYLLMPLEQQC
jgi:transcriptional regulator with XRE-family HTH domain